MACNPLDTLPGCPHGVCQNTTCRARVPYARESLVFGCSCRAAIAKGVLPAFDSHRDSIEDRERNGGRGHVLEDCAGRVPTQVERVDHPDGLFAHIARNGFTNVESAVERIVRFHSHDKSLVTVAGHASTDEAAAAGGHHA